MEILKYARKIKIEFSVKTSVEIWKRIKPDYLIIFPSQENKVSVP